LKDLEVPRHLGALGTHRKVIFNCS